MRQPVEQPRRTGDHSVSVYPKFQTTRFLHGQRVYVEDRVHGTLVGTVHHTTLLDGVVVEFDQFPGHKLRTPERSLHLVKS